MNGRGALPRRGRRARGARPLMSVVVAVALLASLLHPHGAVAAEEDDADLPPGVAILQTRARLSESVPVLPANTARYFRGGYATPFGTIDVYLTETDPMTGLPPVDTAEPVIPACPGIDVVTHDGTLEVLPPSDSAGSDRYRLFLVPVEPSSGETAADVCAFAAEFAAAFTFFLEADADRGRELTFSGNRTPEFPAVLELDT